MGTKNAVLLVALMISFPALSQDFDGKNMMKVNLSAFALKGFNVQYERQLADRVTVALTYGNTPTSRIPFGSYIQKQVDATNVTVARFSLGASTITPALRYYFGKKGAFHGLYVASYARFGSYNISGPVNYGTVSAPRTADFTGKLHATSGGLMLGSSFRLTTRFYLDWWIVGASIGGANGDIRAMTQLRKDEQVSLQKALDDVQVPFTKIQSQVNSSGATVTTTGMMVGMRGLGLNIGFRF